MRLLECSWTEWSYSNKPSTKKLEPYLHLYGKKLYFHIMFPMLNCSWKYKSIWMSYVSYTTRFINVFLLFFHSLPFYEGMTETCSSLTFMTLHDPTLQTPAQTLQTVDKTKSSSAHQPHGVCVGKPPPHVELKISADEPSTISTIIWFDVHRLNECLKPNYFFSL